MLCPITPDAADSERGIGLDDGTLRQVQWEGGTTGNLAHPEMTRNRSVDREVLGSGLSSGLRALS